MTVLYDKQSVNFYRNFVVPLEVRNKVGVIEKADMTTLAATLVRQPVWAVYFFPLSTANTAEGRRIRHFISLLCHRTGITYLVVTTQQGVGTVLYHPQIKNIMVKEKQSFPIMPSDMSVYDGHYHCAQKGDTYYHISGERQYTDEYATDKTFVERLTFMDGSKLFIR